MKKKVIALFLVFCISCTSLISDTNDFKDYESYTLDEFPSWSWKLRRGESLFFGSFAITLPLSILAYNVADNISLIDTSSNDDFTNFKNQLSVAALISLSIALGDYIIGEFE